MTNQIYCFCIHKFEPIPVLVEGQIQQGLPFFKISGLADASIRESKERVANAIKNSGFKLKPSKKYINLLPAGIVKKGSHFDLAIAIALLHSSNEINITDEKILLIGELSLSGELIPVNCIVPIVAAAKKYGISKVFIPILDFDIKSLFPNLKIHECHNLKQVSNILQGKPVTPIMHTKEKLRTLESPEIANIFGLEREKKALEVAMAGNHHLLFIGAKGSGKSSILQMAKFLIPPLNNQKLLKKTSVLNYIESCPQPNLTQAIEINSIDSLLDIFGNTDRSIIGKIHKAHLGSIICNDLNLFTKSQINNLQPLLESPYQSGALTSKFNMLATANPCPCTYLYESHCECRPMSIKNYLEKIEGAFIDRIDIQIKVRKQQFQGKPWDLEQTIHRVSKARQLQLSRGQLNSDLKPEEILKNLDQESKNFLNLAQQKFQFSNRTYVSLLRLSQTIADLNESPVQKSHLLQAIDLKRDFLKEV